MTTIEQYNQYYEGYKRKFPPKASLTFNMGTFWVIFIILIIFGLGIGAFILLVIASDYQISYSAKADAWANYQIKLHKEE